MEKCKHGNIRINCLECLEEHNAKAIQTLIQDHGGNAKWKREHPEIWTPERRARINLLQRINRKKRREKLNVELKVKTDA
jgi:hypothetical protein